MTFASIRDCPSPKPRPCGCWLRELKALRRSRGWSQEQLAERVAMQRSYLADLELGKRNPSVRTLVKVANAFGITVAALFDGESGGNQS
jgi:transcriptional regulator with XRE-family HTH domain